MVKAGDSAPEFGLKTAHDPPDGEFVREVTLTSLLREGPAVLAFFPAAFTGGCEIEMCSLRDNMKALGEAQAAVVGISADTPFSQKAFAAQNNLSFPLLSDPGGKVAAEYGVAYDDFLGMGRAAKRSVFVVNPAGLVVYAWATDDPSVQPDLDAVLSATQAAR